MSSIPYARQQITIEDIEAVSKVLLSDWLTQGPAVERFEEAVAAYCGARYAVAVNSATSALHIACLAAGLNPADTLWTSPITFVASANCALYCGASPDFVDINPSTCNLSVAEMERKLATVRTGGGRIPKVVIPVHFAGQSCEMEKIDQLAVQYGFSIIEDASHAIGGEYQGRKIGCCAFSTMTVFSFHPVKIITSGEGGMVLTNDEGLYKQLIRLRSHGITRDPALIGSSAHGPWYYEQVELGYNYRMTDIQAALGLSQLQRIEQFVLRRRLLAQRYDAALSGLPLMPLEQRSDCLSAHHLYVVRLQLEKIALSRLEVFEKLRSAGINANVHYIPVHTQPVYRQMGFCEGDFPESERYYRAAISLPLYPAMTYDEQDFVIECLIKVLK